MRWTIPALMPLAALTLSLLPQIGHAAPYRVQSANGLFQNYSGVQPSYLEFIGRCFYKESANDGPRPCGTARTTARWKNEINFTFDSFTIPATNRRGRSSFTLEAKITMSDGTVVTAEPFFEGNGPLHEQARRLSLWRVLPSSHRLQLQDGSSALEWIKSRRNRSVLVIATVTTKLNGVAWNIFNLTERAFSDSFTFPSAGAAWSLKPFVTPARPIVELNYQIFANAPPETPVFAKTAGREFSPNLLLQQLTPLIRLNPNP